MLSLIAAVGKNYELGKNGGLVFHLKDDMRFFREVTDGHKIVMGHRTWKSLPGKLPGRENIVVSKGAVEGADAVVSDLPMFVRKYQNSDEEIFVIGGAMIYNELLPHAQNIYLTEIEDEDAEADTFFPQFDKMLYDKRVIRAGEEEGVKYTIVRYRIKNRKESMRDRIFDLIDQEKRRQSEGLELIPSENYVSSAVLQATGSILTNKYSEGYPSFNELEGGEEEIIEQVLPNYRYYGGQENIDRIERIAIKRACEIFRADHANVQPHSGAQANTAVYYAWLKPGDTVLGMSLPAGGHLTHGAKVTMSAKIWNFVGYGVSDDGDIDYDEMERLALEQKPKIILVGYSAFMKIPDFERVAKIRERVVQESGHEVLLMADMSHVAGLIAGGVHPNPLDFGFDVMTTTTHKTLRGPRGGLILSKGIVSSPLKRPEHKLENLPTLIDRAVFPGTQGGPLEHIVAAKAVAFGEAMQPDFANYAKAVVENAKTLAEELLKLDFILQGDGTENHLLLLNVKESFGFDGKFYERALDMVGLTLNANSLPNDGTAAFRPSGVRLGTPAVTTRGLGKAEMRQLALWMKKVADICIDAGEEANLTDYSAELETIREEVRMLATKFPLPQ